MAVLRLLVAVLAGVTLALSAPRALAQEAAPPPVVEPTPTPATDPVAPAEPAPAEIRAAEPAPVASTPIAEPAPPPSPPPSTPRLWLGIGLEVEMELVDVEGEGGFQNQDSTQLRTENRAARAGLDKAIIMPVLGYGDLVTFQAEFRSNDGGAFIDRAYARSKWFGLAATGAGPLELRAELGKNHPFVRAERRTEVYPLIGTAYWKAREYHGNLELRLAGENVNAIVGVTAAQKRPLAVEEAAEDRSFLLLVYDDHRTVIGSNLTYGGKLGFGAYGANVLGWGFTGKMMDNHDTQFLDQNLFQYRDLGDRADDTFYWYGGRFTYDAFGVHAIAEYIASKDGLLPRHGWYAGLSYDAGPLLGVSWMPRLEPIVRYNELTIEDLAENPDESESWDRDMLVAGLLIGLTDVATIKVEYYWLGEATGDDTDDYKDNQLLVQLKLELDPVTVWRQGEPDVEAQ